MRGVHDNRFVRTVLEPSRGKATLDFADLRFQQVQNGGDGSSGRVNRKIREDALNRQGKPGKGGRVQKYRPGLGRQAGSRSQLRWGMLVARRLLQFSV